MTCENCGLDLERPAGCADCVTLTARVAALESRIASIAALLGADPVQDTEADLRTIEVGLAGLRVALREACDLLAVNGTALEAEVRLRKLAGP